MKKNYDVLIVEDELETQKTLGYMLKGYESIFCDSEKKMNEILKESEIKLFIVDIGLRGSKNGLDIIRDLRSIDKYSTKPILCVTSYVNFQQKTNAFAAGVNEFLEKPFSKSTLLEILKKYLTDAKV